MNSVMNKLDILCKGTFSALSMYLPARLKEDIFSPVVLPCNKVFIRFGVGALEFGVLKEMQLQPGCSR